MGNGKLSGHPYKYAREGLVNSDGLASIPVLSIPGEVEVTISVHSVYRWTLIRLIAVCFLLAK